MAAACAVGGVIRNAAGVGMIGGLIYVQQPAQMGADRAASHYHSLRCFMLLWPPFPFPLALLPTGVLLNKCKEASKQAKEGLVKHTGSGSSVHVNQDNASNLGSYYSPPKHLRLQAIVQALQLPHCIINPQLYHKPFRRKVTVCCKVLREDRCRTPCQKRNPPGGKKVCHPFLQRSKCQWAV